MESVYFHILTIHTRPGDIVKVYGSITCPISLHSSKNLMRIQLKNGTNYDGLENIVIWTGIYTDNDVTM